jgi:hypothetical protein
MPKKVISRGAQWPLAIGGGVLNNGVAAESILDGYVTVGELPAGAILQQTDLIITEAFDGTTPTIQVVYTDLDGSNPVELVAATAATAVDRVTAEHSTVNQLTAPKLLKLKGAASATDSTTGKAVAYCTCLVEGKSNEVDD